MDIKLAKQLQKYTEEAIRLAYSKRHSFDEAINWSDIRCADVEYIQSLCNENSHYRVLIEEAAPGCVQFCNYIAAYIINKSSIRPDRFEVVTEW